MKNKILTDCILLCILQSVNNLSAKDISDINSQQDSISPYYDYGVIDSQCIEGWFETYCLDNLTSFQTIDFAYGINVPNIGTSNILDVCHPRYHIATRTYLPKFDGIYRIEIIDSIDAINKKIAYKKTFQTTSNYTNLGDGSCYRDESCAQMEIGRHYKTEELNIICKIYGGIFDYDTSGKPTGILKPANGTISNPIPDVIRRLVIIWDSSNRHICTCNFKEKSNNDINIPGLSRSKSIDTKLCNNQLIIRSKIGEDIHSVSIYDMFGKMVISESFSSHNNYSVDLSNLKKAMYIIQVYAESGFIASKIYLK